jgi:hypothetical protein
MATTPISSATRFTELERPSQQTVSIEKTKTSLPSLSSLNLKQGPSFGSSNIGNNLQIEKFSPAEEFKVMAQHIPEQISKLLKQLAPQGILLPEQLPIELVRSAFNFKMNRPANAMLTLDEFAALERGESKLLRSKKTTTG